MIRFNERKKIFYYIVQIGAGANGGYILQQCAQMMNIFKVQGFYLVADPDTVEQKNLANQLFIPKDVGQKKAAVLDNRYRSHYQVPIAAFDERYIEDERTLDRLFQFTDYRGCYSWDTFFLPILIGAVDKTTNARSCTVTFSVKKSCSTSMWEWKLPGFLVTADHEKSGRRRRSSVTRILDGQDK